MFRAVLKPLTAMMGAFLATHRVANAPKVLASGHLAPIAPSSLGATIARRRGKGRDFSIPRQKVARTTPHGKMRLYRSYAAVS